MTFSTLLRGVTVCGCLFACQWPYSRSQAPLAGKLTGKSTALERDLIDASNAFGFKLFVRLSEDDSTGNLLISPLGISMALSMARNGARGLTEAQMASTLGFAGRDRDRINAFYSRLVPGLDSVDPQVRLYMANSIWTRAGFPIEPGFYDRNRSDYRAEIRELDFGAAGAAAIINRWVEERTGGKIRNLVADPIGSEIKMLLLNAIHFKGAWSRPFPAGATRPAVFHKSGGTESACMLMASAGQVRMARNDSMTAVEIPYGQSRFAMDLIRPEGAGGLEGLIAALATGAWKDWQSRFSDSARALVPRMKLEYRKSLRGALKAMGMSEAFLPAADFSGISPKGSLFISDVLHETYLEANEEGTEAAAATQVIMALGSANPRLRSETVVRFDRPFLFLIRELDTGAIVFAGAVRSP